jgi:gluconate 2-dehydrogenase gamma chain
MTMQRRDFLARLSVAATLPFALHGSDTWAAALSRRAKAAPAGAMLESGQLQLLGSISEGIIPTTDTPGAIGAEVPAFIAMLYAERFTAAEQEAFRTGLNDLAASTRSQFSREFADCSGEQQLQLLRQWDTEAASARRSGAAPPFFARLRAMVVIAYYTSQVGWEQELKVRYGGAGELADGPLFGGAPFSL